VPEPPVGAEEHLSIPEAGAPTSPVGTAATDSRQNVDDYPDLPAFLDRRTWKS
jgi:hypothetical protein